MVACTNAIPYEYGMKGAPQFTAFSGNLGTTASLLGGFAINGVTATLLSGPQRIFAGTSGRLYEYIGGAWTDRSRGANYGGVSAWDFAQFGDATLAANLMNVLQRSPGLGSAFADVAASPQSLCVETAAGFVLLFNTVEGTYGTSPDRWW